MNDLNHTHIIYRIQTKVKAGFVFDDTDDLKTSLANNESPLDTIIDCQRIDNEHITKIKTKKYIKEIYAVLEPVERVRLYTSCGQFKPTIIS